MDNKTDLDNKEDCRQSTKAHARTSGKYDLAGRIEVVQLKGLLSGGEGIGHVIKYYGSLDEDEVMVVNGRLVINEDMCCLARFDNKSRTTMANFISSDVPRNFVGLDPERYVLYGSWKYWMDKEGRFPTLSEINTYYDPGYFCWVAYLRESSSPVLIRKEEICDLGYKDYAKIIAENLPHPRRASRLILAESEFSLEDVVQKISEAGLVPIRLDNLEINRRILDRKAKICARKFKDPDKLP